jgi:hypothetical protein
MVIAKNLIRSFTNACQKLVSAVLTIDSQSKNASIALVKCIKAISTDKLLHHEHFAKSIEPIT